MEQDNIQLNKNKDFIFYKKSEAKQKSHGKNVYDLRFDKLKDSFIFKNIFVQAKNMFDWKTKYNTGKQTQPKDLLKLQKLLPIFKPDFPIHQNKIYYTWIGHSTAVISIGNQANFIIDPVFADRASPVQFLGPKRFRKPACTVDQLPNIDCVLVSHDHYDHLDQTHLQKIYYRFNSAIFMAGLQSQDVFPKKSNFKALQWTVPQQIDIKGKKFTITFVPVCHWGRRLLNDTCTRLWGGFVIQTPKKKKIFYSGDTAYCEVFKEIGQHFGGFDLSILPIGAYEPRQLLSPQHVNPEQAVLIHKDIKSKKSVGVHWGTFPLGSQHYTQARQDLEIACAKQGLNNDEFITIPHGGVLQIQY